MVKFVLKSKNTRLWGNTGDDVITQKAPNYFKEPIRGLSVWLTNHLVTGSLSKRKIDTYRSGNVSITAARYLSASTASERWNWKKKPYSKHMHFRNEKANVSLYSETTIAMAPLIHCFAQTENRQQARGLRRVPSVGSLFKAQSGVYMQSRWRSAE